MGSNGGTGTDRVVLFQKSTFHGGRYVLWLSGRIEWIDEERFKTFHIPPVTN